jgi:hypothetical protein
MIIGVIAQPRDNFSCGDLGTDQLPKMRPQPLERSLLIHTHHPAEPGNIRVQNGGELRFTGVRLSRSIRWITDQRRADAFDLGKTICSITKCEIRGRPSELDTGHSLRKGGDARGFFFFA